MSFDLQRLAVASLIFLVIVTAPVRGQKTGALEDDFNYSELVGKAYGLDQELVNGVQYYNRYRASLGHPYFLGDMFQMGSATIRGRNYSDVKLKYDLFSQHLEVEYQDFSGGEKQIILVTDWVQAFLIGQHQFQKLNLEEDQNKYYQVIKMDCFTCYVHWSKERIPLKGSTTHSGEFAEAKRTLFLEMDRNIKGFKKRKQFVSLFPVERQKQIKRYMKKIGFQIRNATPDEMILHMNAVCNYLNDGGPP